MLVSHDHRFIFLKTLKTAGTSIEGYFGRYCVPPGTYRMEHACPETITPSGIIGARGSHEFVNAAKTWKNHMSAAAVREALGEELWTAYTRFTAVRDPYDKVLSYFYFWLTDEQRTALSAADFALSKQLFNAWVCSGELEKRQSGIVDRDKYVIDGEVCIEFFIRYENLHADVQRFCELKGLEFDPAALPTYKKGNRDNLPPPHDYYTPDSARLVEQILAFEFDYFGYPRIGLP